MALVPHHLHTMHVFLFKPKPILPAKIKAINMSRHCLVKIKTTGNQFPFETIQPLPIPAWTLQNSGFNPDESVWHEPRWSAFHVWTAEKWALGQFYPEWWGTESFHFKLCITPRGWVFTSDCHLNKEPLWLTFSSFAASACAGVTLKNMQYASCWWFNFWGKWLPIKCRCRLHDATGSCSFSASCSGCNHNALPELPWEFLLWLLSTSSTGLFMSSAKRYNLSRNA